MAAPVKMFLGVPQTSKIQVYKVDAGMRATIKQMVFTNTEDVDAKVTITVNTIDVIKNKLIPAGTTEVMNSFIVLEQTDTLSISQEKENAINATISGILE